MTVEDNQLFMVDGIWMNRERMLERRFGKVKTKSDVELETPVSTETEGGSVVDNEPLSTEADELTALRKQCDEKGITYHHRAGADKLKGLLEASE